MSGEHGLREHLKQARQTVGAWPEWKKRALGGGATTERRAPESARAQPLRPAGSAKKTSDCA